VQAGLCSPVSIGRFHRLVLPAAPTKTAHISRGICIAAPTVSK
jgi:hypothetical protein